MLLINIVPEKDAQISPWLEARKTDITALTGKSLPELKEKYGVTGAPETFILDSDYRAFFWHVGYQPGDEEAIEAEVRLLLGMHPFE